VLRLAPPLCITNEETDQLVSVVVDSVRALAKSVGG
jgi:adenosylmethionine-8-amino-7-oxononanoate aminotransferase